MGLYLASQLEVYCALSTFDFDMYDHLYINEKCKYYILELADRDYVNYMYDLDLEQSIDAHYVSRTVFDIILEGIKKKGFNLHKAVLD